MEFRNSIMIFPIIMLYEQKCMPFVLCSMSYVYIKMKMEKLFDKVVPCCTMDNISM